MCSVSLIVLKAIIEVTTCFHEFSQYESTNCFTNISQLERKQIPYCSRKTFFSQFCAIWENQNKYYICIWKKSWKHVVSLTFLSGGLAIIKNLDCEVTWSWGQERLSGMESETCDFFNMIVQSSDNRMTAWINSFVSAGHRFNLRFGEHPVDVEDFYRSVYTSGSYQRAIGVEGPSSAISFMWRKII